MPEETVDLDALWSHAIDGLTDSTVTPQQRAWLRTTRPLGLLDDTALLAAPNEFTKDVLETRLRPMITDALSRLLGREIRVAVTVEPPPGPPVGATVVPLPVGGNGAADGGPDQVAEETMPGMSWPPPSAAGGRLARVEPARLNPKYTFETFVIGSSNRFAHAAAVAVAESPAKAYNPLFIYGGSGLGKTHLLHAIGHYATTLGQRPRRCGTSRTEEFTNDFINSLRDDKTSAFQRRYRDVDILLIDDIQFLENRERTQEEFFHTFNTLHNANKQIVITSDRSPKQLATLEDRLRTRFEWGLLADIQPPDLETRIAILQKKAAQERLYAPPDVLEFIASRIQTRSASSRAR